MTIKELDDGRPTTASLQNGATVTNSFDALDRLTSRLLTTGSATLTTTLTYLTGANGSKTGMIASYQNGTDDAYTYTGEFMP